MKRSSGILMPVFSLPSPYGIGTIGKSAYDFVDFLHAAGQSWWQFLPLGPAACGNSPYSAVSSFAGNPYYIDLDMLMQEGLLCSENLKGRVESQNSDCVDYKKLFDSRIEILRIAFDKGREKLRDEIRKFRDENTPWVANYALYMALKARFNMTSWTEWPEDIKKRSPEAVERYTSELAEEIAFWVFTQFLFYRQWNALRAYAAEKGIGFIGDIPVYVPLDSADVWSEPQFFDLDEDYVPREVSGVPPDVFCEEGQLWGNPLYNYEAMRRDGYGWWIRRVEGASKLYDAVRIDHFRGFESYWAVPYGEKTAINGVWRKGPGLELVHILTSWFNSLSFIAEDLGILTDDVRKLLSDSGLPGMKVLEFAFDASGTSSYLPHNIGFNSVCYVGTHDNDTVLGWLDTAPEADREFAAKYMHVKEDDSWPWAFIRTGMSTSANLFVAQMQDVLELPGSARTNVPGVAEGNWRWRMLPGAADAGIAEKLLDMTQTFRRI